MDAGISSSTKLASGLFEDELRAIVGAKHVSAARTDDAVSGVPVSIIVEPGTEQELAHVLRLANDAEIAVTPRGAGTKQSWGNPPRRADVILSTARLNQIIEHAWADLTVTVAAGCTIRDLQNALAAHAQQLALDPLWPDRATVGGVISTNDSGALRLRFGSVRDLIIGVTLALPDGTLASSGGKVVKNVAGYDLPKLATGSMGSLGVITRAVFRLHPAARHSRTLTLVPRDVNEAQQLILAMQDSKLAHVSLQLCISSDNSPQMDVLFEGTESGIAAQEAQLKSLVAPARVQEAAQGVWRAREHLWSLPEALCGDFVIVKISALPAEISSFVEALARIAKTQQLRWTAVMQATGLGLLRLDGQSKALIMSLQSLRNTLQPDGGSVAVFERSCILEEVDAWAQTGDALPLMRAVKMQFDPKGTLNPGRFVGGI
jgi:glycolate oxidase FAD binding subunit